MSELIKWSGGTVKCDLVVSFKDERAAEPTVHPIEDGSEIVDHVIQKPDTLSIEIAHTETPLEAEDGFKETTVTLDVRESQFKPGGLLAISSAIGSAVSKLLGGAKPAKTLVLKADTPLTRVDDLHDTLIRIKQEAEPITVTFRGRVYPDLIVTRVTRSYGPRIGLGEFILEATSFRTVSTATVKLPDPADLRDKSAVARGAKPGKVLSDTEKQATEESLLHVGKEALLGGLEGSIQ